MSGGTHKTARLTAVSLSSSTIELGGANTHASRSGVSHFTSPGDAACMQDVRRLVSFLPLALLFGATAAASGAACLPDSPAHPSADGAVNLTRFHGVFVVNSSLSKVPLVAESRL